MAESRAPVPAVVALETPMYSKPGFPLPFLECLDQRTHSPLHFLAVHPPLVLLTDLGTCELSFRRRALEGRK